MANSELREWRKKAHAAFDPLWETKIMSRSSAYKELAQALGKPIKQTHIAMFNIDECKQVIRIADHLNMKAR